MAQTKKRTVTSTDEQWEKLRALSVLVLGKENISGANHLRIFEMVENFIDKRYKAINYTHCCESDIEQLPTGYTKCNCSNAKDRLDCGFECYNK
jgi:hypothetical protein